MRGIEDKPGWFWLFLIEGLLTFVIGLIVCFPPYVSAHANDGRVSFTSPVRLPIPRASSVVDHGILRDRK